jgi:TolB-like protein
LNLQIPDFNQLQANSLDNILREHNSYKNPMSRPSLFFLLILGLLVFLSGCSRLNCTRMETLLGGDVNLVRLGKEVGNELIKHSFPPLLPHQPGQPVLVTTLVNNNNLNDSSSFGRSLQNAITSEFVRRGYVVNELKMRGDVFVRSGEGEFMLSRQLDQLEVKQRAQAVVVGTYTMANRVMYLSVRLVNPGDGSIRSVYEKRICLDENSLRMLGLMFDTDQEDFVKEPPEPLLDKLLY